MNNKIKQNSGFTLIEIAISMFILSFILGMGLLVTTHFLNKISEEYAIEKIEKIADSISIYVQRNTRVPCPADPDSSTAVEPFGTEYGSGATGTDLGNCIASNKVGIIPFSTLGLSEEDVTDPWGNYFTYRVSPTSTLTAADVATGDYFISNWCMFAPVWAYDTDELNTGSYVEDYYNYHKGAFCCGTNDSAASGNTEPSMDIELRGSRDEILFSLNRTENGYGGNISEYVDTTTLPLPPIMPTDTVPTNTFLQDTYAPRFPAYVIVSHGLNDHGAYGRLGTVSGKPALSAAEEENADGDNDFYVSDRLSPINGDDIVGGGINLFKQEMDDIVFWQTPAQAMTRVGRSTCTRP